MMMRHIAGALREVPWSEKRDSGGMFDAEVGVYRDGDGFVAFIYDWGGGIRSRIHPDVETARGDIDRLWERFYG